MGEVLWKALIEIPERVHKSDFVLNLADGVAHGEQTVRRYVVTEGLATAFDGALGLISGALEDKRSKAAYLHGSFGSGKSHFMAVLNLLLEDGENRTGVRELKRLEKVLVKHREWLGRRKLLMVPFHFIGAASMESAILGGYAEFIQKRHPESPLPGVYVADAILANAAALRGGMGDEAFFGMLNEGSRAGRWGQVLWDEGRYGAAASAEPGSQERAKLVGELVSRVLTSVQDTARASGGGEGFVSLDEGLETIAHHARGLGYEGLVLFLDELILWLASRASDLAFIHREGQKLSKLVEAQHAARPIPIVSFVARQRDLREFIGQSHTGAERSSFSDTLQWWEGRFDTITLEDRNLPVIAGERLLRPRTAEAREQIQQSFEALTRRMRPEERDTIRTRGADDATFAQVYPFSPALVQALVALSTFLQRERTALRLMLMLLVEQRETLALGSVVPVGDLWDVVVGGEEPFSEALKQPFRSARELWHNKLLPMLSRDHGLAPRKDDEEEAARPQAFNDDARMLKTLLLASLVPQTEAFNGLTVERLHALNYGSVRSRISGGELSILTRKLQGWASHIGELRLSEDGKVSLQISAIDPDVLLDRANHADNPGNRKRLVRELLFDWLGLSTEGRLMEDHKIAWRGADRQYRVLYRNVREMTLESLKNPDEADWTVAIDYPFDEEGHYPTDDRARLQEHRDQHPEGTHTLGWLPSFLSARGREQLGRLVKIGYVLDRFDDFADELPPTDRPVMKQLLENSRSALRQGLLRALEVSYGLSNEDLDTVDITQGLNEHLFSLHGDYSPRMPGGKSFAETLQALMFDALAARYPEAPKIPHERLAHARTSKMAELIHKSITSPERRVHVEDRAMRQALKEYAQPVELGQMGETHFSHGTDWCDRLTRQLGKKDGDKSEPKESYLVGEIRAAIDPAGSPTGTPRVLQDLIIMAFAWLEDRTPLFKGSALEVTYGKLQDDAVLVRRALPSVEVWASALSAAQAIFGVEGHRMRNAQNLDALAAAAQAAARPHLEASINTLAMLIKVGEGFGLTRAEVTRSPRYVSAALLDALLKSLNPRKPAAATIEALADAVLKPATPPILKGHLDLLAPNLKHLNHLSMIPFEAVARQGEFASEAARGLLAEAIQILKNDEHVRSLDQLKGIHDRLVTLLIAWPPPPPPPPPPPIVDPQIVDPGEGFEVLETMTIESAQDVSGLEAKLRAHFEARGGRRLRIEVKVEREEGDA